MVEYTSVTFKKDYNTKENYAYSYFWENGKRKCHQKVIPYYFFFADIDLNFDPGKFRIIKGFKTVDGKKVNKIIPKNPMEYKDYEKLRDFAKDKVHETDVKILDRLLWEEKPKFTKNIRKWYIDIETMRNSEGQYSEPGEANNKISSITFYDNFNKQYYIFALAKESKQIKKDNRQIYIFNDESKMLLALLKAIDQFQPDCFTGWNVMGYDMPYLLNRMENLGIDRRAMSPIYSVWMSSNSGGDNKWTKNNYFRIYIKGRDIVDLMEISKQFWYGTDVGYSLEAQSQKWLGKGKIKIGDIDKAYKERFWEFVDYNVLDVQLCVELDEKLNMISDMQTFQDVLSINLQDTLTAGKIIVYYIKQNSNIVLNDGTKKESFKLPGGYVHPVAKGIYKNIKKYDFASHYPSIIRSYNISPDTIIYNPTEEEKKNLIHFKCRYKWFNNSNTKGARVLLPYEKEYNDNDCIDFEVWFKKEKGAITKIVDVLTDKRLVYKKENNKSLSTVFKRMINCYSNDHDILTPNGIKNIKDFKIGDKVYTLNPITKKAELDKVKKVYKYKYKGDMYEFKSRACDFLVTPNHNIYYKSKNGNISKMMAEEIYNKSKFNLPSNVSMPSFNNKNNKIDLSKYFNKNDLEIKNNSLKWKKVDNYHNVNIRKRIPRYYNVKDFFSFLGWYISEGGLQYIKSSNSYIVTISQCNKINKYNCLKIEKLFNSMNLKWSKYDNKTYKICSKVLYKFVEKFCGKGSYNKKIPEFCFDYDNDSLEMLYKSLMLGDGNKDGFRYSTKSKKLANDFLYLCLRLGKVAKMYKQDDISYRIRIRNNPVCSIDKNHRKIIKYDGYVYCIECEKNHIIMAGRNNKLRWCGQSIYGQLGFGFSRFFNKECAMTITLLGQWLSKKIIHEIESSYLGVAVMGDTDSFAIDLSKEGTNEKILECAEKIFELSKKEHNLDKVYSKLELEAEIDKMILFGVKKKYAQLIKGKTKVQGLEMIRKDFPEALKDFQRTIIKRIFEKDDPTLSDVKEVKQEVSDRVRTNINKKDPFYYSMPSVIKKDTEDYETKTAEVKALKNSGLVISKNETFWILPCEGDKDLAFKSKEDLKHINYKPDYNKALNKIFKNIGIFNDLFVKQTNLMEY